MSPVSPQFLAPSPVAPAPCGYLARLLVRAGRGDLAAFTLLYDQTCTVVYRLALELPGSPSAAEQLTQTVYVAIWSQSPSYRPDEVGAMTWILTVARACARGRSRRAEATAEPHGDRGVSAQPIRAVAS